MNRNNIYVLSDNFFFVMLLCNFVLLIHFIHIVI